MNCWSSGFSLRRLTGVVRQTTPFNIWSDATGILIRQERRLKPKLQHSLLPLFAKFS
jgi:hypothetical protein